MPASKKSAKRRVAKLIEFPAEGAKSRGYLAKPESGKGPGLLMLHEWWGLVPHIHDVCDRFSAEGFVTLAPDLYHGEVAAGPEQAGRMMMALNLEQAEKEIRGAVEYLTAHSSKKKLATVGFSMGGKLALLAACANPNIGACVDFYGIHPKAQPKLEALDGPFLGIFAEKDAFVTVAQARDLESKLRALGKRCEFHVYSGVDHSFFNDSRADVYSAGAAKDAWQRTLRFLRESLR